MENDFVELFDQWANSYDQTVAGHDIEYRDVFLHYDEILQQVADRSFGHVLEFGPGTGNLTVKLIIKGLSVIGVEPSGVMRKIAQEKVAGRAEIIEGHFFHFPQNLTVQTIASSYAFHHLTDGEKAEAIASYRNILPSGGKIVFADTIYESVKSYQKAIRDASQKGFHNLAHDLQSEYYTTLPVLTAILNQNGFDVEFEQCNDFVWIMEAIKR